jgi:hypothetical protein
MRRVYKKVHRSKDMPNTDAEDYHFPRNQHPCKAKPEQWMAMMELKGFKVR